MGALFDPLPQRAPSPNFVASSSPSLPFLLFPSFPPHHISIPLFQPRSLLALSPHRPFRRFSILQLKDLCLSTTFFWTKHSLAAWPRLSPRSVRFFPHPPRLPFVVHSTTGALIHPYALSLFKKDFESRLVSVPPRIASRAVDPLLRSLLRSPPFIPIIRPPFGSRSSLSSATGYSTDTTLSKCGSIALL
jgi:hypothetical protein